MTPSNKSRSTCKGRTSRAFSRILIVGGTSRAAMAFRQRLTKSEDVSVTVLTRRPCSGLGRETLVVVNDYFSPSRLLLSQCEIVFNFVGAQNNRLRDSYNAVNVQGPARLAFEAKSSGVERLIHLSSLSVYGDAQDIDRNTSCHPNSDYGRSKLEADSRLLEMIDENFSVTLLRIPILYGLNAGTKLRMLASFLTRIRCFPIPAVENVRSILHLDNLAVVLTNLISDNLEGIQFAADPQPFSISTLAEVIHQNMGRSIKLVRFPNIFFDTLKLAQPRLYDSLYARSLVRQTNNILEPQKCAVSLPEGLRQILPKLPL